MAARTAKKKLIKMNTNPIEGLNSQPQPDRNSNNTPELIGKQLPPGFAEEVLKLEMDLEISDSVELKQIHRLIELYSLGVGFYESIGDSKYMYFHKKMNNLMLKPVVQEAMNNSVKEQQEIKRRASLQQSTLLQNQLPQQQQQTQIQQNTNNLISADNGNSNLSQQSTKSAQPLIQKEDSAVSQYIQPNMKSQSNNNTNLNGIISSSQLKTELVQQQTEQEKEKEVEEKKFKQRNLIKKKTVEENIKLNIIYGMQDNEDKSKSILKMHQIDQQRNKDIVNKEVESQMDIIKKRLESRRNQQKQFSRALSLTIHESDTSLSDIDVVQPLPETGKKFVTSQTNLDEDIIEEDEKEEIFTRENSRKNSLDFSAMKEGNLSIVDQLTKERNVDEILAMRSKRKSYVAARKSGRLSLMNNHKLVSKAIDSTRVRSLSNDHIQNQLNNNDHSVIVTPFDTNTTSCIITSSTNDNQNMFNNICSMIEPSQ